MVTRVTIVTVQAQVAEHLKWPLNSRLRHMSNCPLYKLLHLPMIRLALMHPVDIIIIHLIIHQHCLIMACTVDTMDQLVITDTRVNRPPVTTLTHIIRFITLWVIPAIHLGHRIHPTLTHMPTLTKQVQWQPVRPVHRFHCPLFPLLIINLFRSPIHTLFILIIITIHTISLHRQDSKSTFFLQLLVSTLFLSPFLPLAVILLLLPSQTYILHLFHLLLSLSQIDKWSECRIYTSPFIRLGLLYTLLF